MFKKITSILLSVLIFVSSISGLIITGSATDTGNDPEQTVTLEQYVENESNWYIEDAGSDKLGKKAADSWAKATVDTTADNCYYGTQSVKLHTRSQYATINLGEYIKPNTKYTLTFKYKSATLATKEGVNCAIESFGIYAKDYTGAILNVGQTGFVSRKAYNSYWYWSNNNFVGDPNWLTGTTALSASDTNSWQTAEIEFKSQQYTNLTLIIMSAVDDLYIDSVELLVDPESYYETPANWKSNLNTATTIDSTTATSATAVINSQVVANGAQSLLINQPHQNVWIPLNGIDANKHYKITFSYQVNALDGNGAAFERIGVYAPDVDGASFEATKKGFIAYADKDWSYYWKNDNFVGEPEWTTSIFTTKLESTDLNTWQTITFEFHSYSYTNLALEFKTAATKLYLDGFEVSEVLGSPESEYENEAKWKFDTVTNATTIGGTPTTLSKPAVRTTSSDKVKVGTQSLSVSAKNHYMSFDLSDKVEAQKQYKLTFWYYANTNSLASEDGKYFAIKTMGIYSPGKTGAALAWNNSAFATQISYNGGYQWLSSSNQDWITATEIANGEYVTALEQTDVKKWHQAEISFSTLSYTDLNLVLQICVDNVYLDGFVLTEILPDAEDYFEDEKNWTFDTVANATTIGGTPTTITNPATRTTSSSKVKVGSQALTVAAKNHYMSINIANKVKANKQYKLRFWYYADVATLSNEDGNYYAIKTMGIYSPSKSGASLAWNNPAYVTQITYNAGYEWTSSQQNWISSRTKIDSSAVKTWHQAEITFNTLSYTDLHLVLQVCVDNIYLDGFEVSEVLPDPESYYETPSNWKYDVEGATTISALASAKLASAFQNIETYAVGSQSVLIKQPYQNVWIPLEDIEANKHYKITFKYHLDKRGTNGSGFEKVGVYAPDVDGASFEATKKGFIAYADKDNSYYWYNNNFEGSPEWTTSTFTTALEETDLNTWQTITLEFYSYSYTNLSLVFKVAADNLYLDGFEVNEVLADPESYYETPANWKYNTDSETTIDTATAKSATASQNNKVVVDGEQSILIKQQYQYAWIPLENVVADKHYKLTFKYNVNALGGDSESFIRIGVYAPDVDGASFGNIPGKGFVSYAQHDTSYYWKNDNFEGEPEWTTSTLKTKLETTDLNTWQTITLEFYSHSYTNLSLVFRTAATNVYLDGFTLTEVTSGTNPNPDPNPGDDTPIGPYTPESYFETESNWVFDAENATTVGSAPTDSWVKATTNVDTVKDGEQSLKINAPYRLMSIKMPDDIKANTEYKLSFWYNAPTLGTETMLDTGKTYHFGFRSISIYSAGVDGAKLGWGNKGTIVSSAINGSYTTNDFTTFNYGTQGTTALTEADAGTWKKAEIYFKTDDFTDLYLVMKAFTTVYVDGFELSAMIPESYYEDPANWGFEDGGLSKNIGDSPSTWANATYSDYVAHDGKLSLKIHAPYQYSYIPLPDELEPNTEYTLTFWQYTDKLGSEYQQDKDKTYYFGIRTYSIYTPDVKNAEFGWNKPGAVTNISFNGSYMAAKNFEPSQAVWSVGGITTELNKNDGGKWHKLSINFKTEEHTNLHLLLQTYSDPIYLDGFELSEATPGSSSSPGGGTNPNPDPNPGDDTPTGPYTPESYFETESNWIFDAENATDVGSVPAESWVKATTNVTTVKEGKQSLKINAPYRLMSIKMPDDIKANTEYKLSFWYNAPTLGTETMSDTGDTYYFGFRSISIYSAGVDGAKLGWGNKGTIVSSAINGSYTTNDFTTFNYGTQSTTALKETDAGTWKKAEIYFKTDDFTDLYLVMKAFTMIYVDGFELTAMIPESYYEDPANWGFEDGELSKNIGDSPSTWANATYSDYVAHDGKLSLKLHAPYQYSYIALPGDLEPYTEYTLTFWQYTDKLGSNHQIDEDKTYYYGIRTYGIYTPDVEDAEFGWNKPGTLTNISFNGSYMAAENFEASQAVWSVGGISTELNKNDGGKWHKLSITFKTQEYTNLHLLLQTYSDPIYLDGFELSEAPSHETIWTDGPQRKMVIDFEDKYDYFNGSKVFVVEETEGMDGKTTNAMHIKARKYDPKKTNVTVLNWNPVRTNTDPVFTFPVTPNTLYKMSVKMKVDEWADPNYESMLYVYYDYANEKNITITRTTSVDGQGWAEYSIEFTTKEHQKWTSFGINVGNTHPSIWLDDITLISYERGLITNTDVNYALDFFNILDDENIATEGTAVSSTVLKVPVKANTLYTLGVNLSGSGTFTTSYDAKGSDLIKKVKVTSEKTRHGFVFMTGDEDEYVYLTFDPSGGIIKYDEFYFFLARAVSFKYEMGFTENPNNVETPTYTIEYVDAYDAIRSEDIIIENEIPEEEDIFDIEEDVYEPQYDDVTEDYDDSNEEASPETGESAAVLAVIITFLSAVAVMGFSRKKQYQK